MTNIDRPYPFFSVNADKFIAREGEYSVEYDLGLCWIAYNDMVELYDAAANAVDGGGDEEMAKLRDVVVKVNGDFKKAGLMIDMNEIRTQKSRWHNSAPDHGTGDEDNETTDSNDSAAPRGRLHPAGVASQRKADQVVEGERPGQTVQA